MGLEQRAAGLGTRSIKTTSKAWALDRIIQLIDLTTLEGADTPGKVRSLVAKALKPDASDPTCPRVAAVCVYGDMVPHAVEALGAAHGDPDDGPGRSPPWRPPSRAAARRSRSSSPTPPRPSRTGPTRSTW